MLSKAHHYIPQCYLKGFTHNGKQLFIYDKKDDVIRPSDKSKAFFISNRNTLVRADGTKDDWLEKVYGEVEAESAYLFPKIINSTPDKEALTYLDKLKLSMFISTLFWRVPLKDEESAGLLAFNKLRNGLFYMKYPDWMTEADRRKYENLLVKSDTFKRAYSFMLSFEPYANGNMIDFIKDWKIYYIDAGRFLTGDNPVIIRSGYKPHTILNHFIFPISPDKILVATKGKPELDWDWIVNIGLQIIKQADRFACSNNKEFLEALVIVFKKENHASNDALLKQLIFKAIE